MQLAPHAKRQPLLHDRNGFQRAEVVPVELVTDLGTSYTGTETPLT